MQGLPAGAENLQVRQEGRSLRPDRIPLQAEADSQELSDTRIEKIAPMFVATNRQKLDEPRVIGRNPRITSYDVLFLKRNFLT